MILEYVIIFILAKIKKFKFSPLLKAYALYPFVLIELIYLFLQVNTFLGNYQYYQYAYAWGFKNWHLIALLPAVIAYKVYKPAFVGSIFVFIGTALNNWVIALNGGKMHIFPTLSKLTGYYKPGAIKEAHDTLHSLFNGSVKMPLLVDIIDTGYSIISFGDILIHSFIVIVIYYSIKELNERLEIEKV